MQAERAIYYLSHILFCFILIHVLPQVQLTDQDWKLAFIVPWLGGLLACIIFYVVFVKWVQK